MWIRRGFLSGENMGSPMCCDRHEGQALGPGREEPVSPPRPGILSWHPGAPWVLCPSHFLLRQDPEEARGG